MYMDRKRSIATLVRDVLREEDEMEEDDDARRKLSFLDTTLKEDEEDDAMDRMEEQIRQRMEASSKASCSEDTWIQESYMTAQREATEGETDHSELLPSDICPVGSPFSGAKVKEQSCPWSKDHAAQVPNN